MNEKRLFGITVLIISLLVSFFLCGQAWAVDVQISQLVDDPDPAIRGGNFTYFEEAKTS
jgi:hypothetical protein